MWNRVARFSAVCLLILGGAMLYADEPAAAPTVASLPPVVIRTEPISGSLNVDPAMTELKVTFSKDMSPGGYSWTQISDESFPKTTGKAHYLADGRTCVLPVQLEPGKTYVTWLNSGRFMGFRDIGGHAAVPYLLVFQTRSETK